MNEVAPRVPAEPGGRVSPGRWMLGTAGVLVAGYGAFRLFELGWSNLVATVVWLAGAVLGHDALLAPATIVVCALGIAVLPARWRGPAAGGLLVLGTVTLTAVPVLGRWGARPDNPTLLDRSYWLGWIAFAAVVLAGTLVAGLRGRKED